MISNELVAIVPLGSDRTRCFCSWTSVSGKISQRMKPKGVPSPRRLRCRISLVLMYSLLLCAARPQTSDVCPRPEPGSIVTPPADLRSTSGKLAVELMLRTSQDKYGNSRYCYVYGTSTQAPTLRVNPGDQLVLTLRNELPIQTNETQGHQHSINGIKGHPCAAGSANPSSTNLHFHGLDLPPDCHQDDVLHTVIQPNTRFEYRLKIPPGQPPGLYWYHPHLHGWSEAQVLGGASGAIIVEGIERARPETAGLAERVLILRDQLQGEKYEESGEHGENPKDISINFIPIVFAHLVPATLKVRPQEREFWRVLNASADTLFNLRLLYQRGQYDFVPETLNLIGIDGVPIDPDSHLAKSANVLLAPGARAEFIITTPPAGMSARLTTEHYDSGPQGEFLAERIIANLVSTDDSQPAVFRIPPISGDKETLATRLDAMAPARQRKLFFSEDRPDLTDPKLRPSYYITVEGQPPKTFDMTTKEPQIVATQGTVEDWTIENRAREAHTFHIHQLHFQLLERDGKAVHDGALRDTIDMPFWSGEGPYPSIKLRMDLRSPRIIGTFVYHCHILEHEDAGMMGRIEVRPPNRH
jgi:FtsP/CotA-like multicopper oxidase with cupredoxin domain